MEPQNPYLAKLFAKYNGANSQLKKSNNVSVRHITLPVWEQKRNLKEKYPTITIKYKVETIPIIFIIDL